jgi:hypothetical protein
LACDKSSEPFKNAKKLKKKASIEEVDPASDDSSSDGSIVISNRKEPKSKNSKNGKDKSTAIDKLGKVVSSDRKTTEDCVEAAGRKTADGNLDNPTALLSEAPAFLKELQIHGDIWTACMNYYISSPKARFRTA